MPRRRQRRRDAGEQQWRRHGRRDAGEQDQFLSRISVLFLIAVLWFVLTREQHFWKGLQEFSVAAEKQMNNKHIPNINQWRSQRIETIKTLKELRQKLDTVCFSSNCGKSAVSGMSILGIISSLATIPIGIIGVPFSLPLLSVGGILCPAGRWTKEASSIIESILSAKYQNYFQAVLLKDRDVSIPLDEWLKITPNLEKEFQKIFVFDLKSENSMKFVFLSEFHKFLIDFKNFQSALEHMKSGKYASLLGDSIGIDELQKFSKQILDSSSFSDEIRRSLDILCSVIGATNYRSLVSVYQKIQGENISSEISFLHDKLDIEIPFKVKLSAFILLDVLYLAKEITSFIDETKIKIDGECPYSDSIGRITDMLEQELKMIESTFTI